MIAMVMMLIGCAQRTIPQAWHTSTRIEFVLPAETRVQDELDLSCLIAHEGANVSAYMTLANSRSSEVWVYAERQLGAIRNTESDRMFVGGHPRLVTHAPFAPLELSRVAPGASIEVRVSFPVSTHGGTTIATMVNARLDEMMLTSCYLLYWPSDSDVDIEQTAIVKSQGLKMRVVSIAKD